jgi:hypothetical protein
MVIALGIIGTVIAPDSYRFRDVNTVVATMYNAITFLSKFADLWSQLKLTTWNPVDFAADWRRRISLLIL